jgi:RNA polymerase sigma factor (sigma-70 family)
MKIPQLDNAVVAAATGGDLGAMDTLLMAIQPGIYNLAVRMLGQRDDASDATQEILLKVVTHLAQYRAEAGFGTWVFQIARNHLLTAVTRAKESPEVSLDAIRERLQQGLDYAAATGTALADKRGVQSLTPEDKLAARQVALGCTQNMLMALDREQRLAYILDAVFALPSQQAAQVLGIEPDAYRKRLSRARALLAPLFADTCGLANPAAPCRCERQMPALHKLRADATSAGGAPSSSAPGLALHRREQAQTAAQFDALLRMSDAAAVFRAHPEYLAPESITTSIRSVLRQEGFWPAGVGRSLQ